MYGDAGNVEYRRDRMTWCRPPLQYLVDPLAPESGLQATTAIDVTRLQSTWAI